VSLGRNQGSIHYFTKSEKKEGPIAGFDLIAERIRLSPSWMKRLGYTLENNELGIVDLAGLNTKIRKWRVRDPATAPAVEATTYIGLGQLETEDFVRNWANKQFTVATDDPYYFFHDIFNHSVYGYLLLPTSYVEASSKQAQFLLELKKLELSEKQKKALENLIEDFGASLDGMTEKINGSLIYRSKKSTSSISKALQDHIEKLPRSLNESFLTLLSPKQTAAVEELKKTYGMNKNISKAQLRAHAKEIMHRFAGHSSP
jgi:hypothetical protein